MMILGVSLPHLTFLPGLPIPGPETNSEDNLTTLPGSGFIEISSHLIFQIGLAFGIILLFIFLITALLKKMNFKVVSTLMGLLAILFALFSMLIHLSSNQFVTIPVDKYFSEQPPHDYQVAPIGDPPAYLLIWVSVGLLLASIILIGWLIARVFHRSQKENALAVEAESAIQAITNGESLDGVIIRYYLMMEKVISQERGIDRDQAVTPHEFEIHLVNKGIPKTPILQLTTLFEKARYGNQRLTEQDELNALNSLSAIQRACQSITEKDQ